MTTTENANSISLPAGLSPEATAWLTMLSSFPTTTPPLPDDLEAWTAATAAAASPEQIDAIALATTGAVRTGIAVEIDEVALSNSAVFVGTPEELPVGDERVLLSIHGGAFTVGGGESARAAAGFVAGAYGVTVWSLDYRMPPKHPYPAALDDCVEAYRALLETHDPTSIAVSGLSAGGNLAAALLLRARDEGLPMPAAVVLNSPLVDLTLSGDTVVAQPFGTDGALANPVALYAGGHDAHLPYLSPLFGAFDEHWPATILFSGTRDFLLSDTVRMHNTLRDAGANAQLHIFEGAPHGLFGGNAPEDRQLTQLARQFLDRAWAGAGSAVEEHQA
ncbi:alpha/beta hydrolase fold domain-containing protein [Arthrobacter sp. efr-133-TYG-118]|uniref:alpha/beta hydrolase fold domain-containing protein n=1 Tax=Arthrobacter sp. efr-133-TYG-118 TaxID=3040279 RepID=UPI00254C2CCC|nr:alpha/beta hydrolase fold domain-containing protein [Arthrobacter sp. efr-133-TYG-118]